MHNRKPKSVPPPRIMYSVESEGQITQRGAQREPEWGSVYVRMRAITDKKVGANDICRKGTGDRELKRSLTLAVSLATSNQTPKRGTKEVGSNSEVRHESLRFWYYSVAPMFGLRPAICNWSVAEIRSSPPPNPSNTPTEVSHKRPPISLLSTKGSSTISALRSSSRMRYTTKTLTRRISSARFQPSISSTYQFRT